MQGVDLALVGKQLDDDDGAGESQRDSDVERFHPALAHGQDEEEADDDGEGQLPQAGGQRDGADMADMLQVEFEANHEQQHRHAHLGQQVDLVMSRDDAQHGGAGDDADDDVGDQHWLAQPQRHGARCGGHQQQQGKLAKDAVHVSGLRFDICASCADGHQVRQTLNKPPQNLAAGGGEGEIARGETLSTERRSFLGLATRERE